MAARRATEAESVAKEGIGRFPADADILGNLSIALTWQDKYEEAKPVAERCLSISRNVHSLEQVALIEMSLGHKEKDKDWPGAVQRFTRSLALLREAKALNSLYSSARLNLAKTLLHLGDHASAIRELDDLVLLDLDDSSVELYAWMKAQCLQAASSFKGCLQFCLAPQVSKQCSLATNLC